MHKIREILRLRGGFRREIAEGRTESVQVEIPVSLVQRPEERRRPWPTAVSNATTDSIAPPRVPGDIDSASPVSTRSARSGLCAHSGRAGMFVPTAARSVTMPVTSAQPTARDRHEIRGNLSRSGKRAKPAAAPSARAPTNAKNHIIQPPAMNQFTISASSRRARAARYRQPANSRVVTSDLVVTDRPLVRCVGT